ncbi:hypothetical protein CLAIMM_13777 [Cladophialophora immunda]|nr:hypothetical protein CLAIMM_13777 [Cladophialophora immunda]
MSDSYSMVYRYIWDKEDLTTYPWKNHYVHQPEVLKYLRHVVTVQRGRLSDARAPKTLWLKLYLTFCHGFENGMLGFLKLLRDLSDNVQNEDREKVMDIRNTFNFLVYRMLALLDETVLSDIFLECEGDVALDISVTGVVAGKAEEDAEKVGAAYPIPKANQSTANITKQEPAQSAGPANSDSDGSQAAEPAPMRTVLPNGSNLSRNNSRNLGDSNGDSNSGGNGGGEWVAAVAALVVADGSNGSNVVGNGGSANGNGGGIWGGNGGDKNSHDGNSGIRGKE